MGLADDEIVKVLRECEGTLRSLTSEGRLTAGALDAFVALSERVKGELNRRGQGDRRRTPRTTLERRH